MKKEAGQARDMSASDAGVDGKLAARFDLMRAEAAAVERLEASLFGLGALGTWERGQEVFGDGEPGAAASAPKLDAYFNDSQWCFELLKACERLGAEHACPFVGFELVIDQDWMAAHRALARPVTVGRFIVDPGEPDDVDRARPADAGGQSTVLQVPARRAFGTGSHETTRLVLQQMQAEDLQGMRVLDVGCGTGVLSFAAHHLGAHKVVGYDVDPVSAVLATQNCRLNSIAENVAFFAGTEASIGVSESFDVALINVLPFKISGSEPWLARLVKRSGSILLSGLLADAASTAEALERWRREGWREKVRRVEAEWVAVSLEAFGDVGELSTP